MLGGSGAYAMLPRDNFENMVRLIGAFWCIFDCVLKNSLKHNYYIHVGLCRSTLTMG